jgi:hypothetical protein
MASLLLLFAATPDLSAPEAEVPVLLAAET